MTIKTLDGFASYHIVVVELIASEGRLHFTRAHPLFQSRMNIISIHVTFQGYPFSGILAKKLRYRIRAIIRRALY